MPTLLGSPSHAVLHRFPQAAVTVFDKALRAAAQYLPTRYDQWGYVVISDRRTPRRYADRRPRPERGLAGSYW
ncbi:hypothetical protein [Enteractinococcus coprophilus]|uniref:hypothetical protein n=1 Tax=Enteractinococcus coprophilus TaxID=1027633 RepID=UPI001152382B|nr:hypothetical protein [Enteractinococcus coprophilus]